MRISTPASPRLLHFARLDPSANAPGGPVANRTANALAGLTGVTMRQAPMRPSPGTGSMSDLRSLRPRDGIVAASVLARIITTAGRPPRQLVVVAPSVPDKPMAISPPALAPRPDAADGDVRFTNDVPARLLYQSRMTDRSVELWHLSKGRPYDTFIGLTDVTTGEFHMRPCFTSTADPGVYTTLFANRDGRPRHCSRAAVESFYGAKDVIVIPHQLAASAMGIDGFAHSTLSNRVGVPPQHCIGWAIKGNAAFAERLPPLAAFSSSRNIPKFRGLERPKGQQSRDLPNSWAQFVLEALKRDLGVAEFATYQEKWAGVGAPPRERGRAVV